MSIPIYGAMTRPDSPFEAIRQVKAGRIEWSGGPLEVTFETNEFTSLCPSTGQPDFNTVQISYQPDKYYIESKSMKFYFWAFRDYGIHCENLAKLICEQIVKAVEPNSCSVTVYQNPRGGVKLVSTYKLRK